VDIIGKSQRNGTPHANGTTHANGTSHESGVAAPPAARDALPQHANGARRNGAPAASGPVRTYEEIEGPEGRAVFFRPHRYTAADLAPLQGTLSVTIAGARHDCPIADVSQNGVAFAWPDEAPVRVKDRLDVVLRFDAHEVFRGSARVGSVRAADGATLVGISFDEFLLDVDDVLQLRAVARWQSERGPALLPHDKAWRVPGGERFKALVSELALLLEDAQHEMNAFEAKLPWHVLQGGANPARATLQTWLRRDFVSEIVRLTEEVDAAVRQLPDAHGSSVAKQWSIRHVFDFLMQAPILHRARYKPFGYPGDYEVMNFLYERHFEGATLFARTMGLAFTHTRAGHAVRYRKDVVKRQLKALLANRAGASAPVRVLSIAAGPAQELYELFGEIDDLPVPMEVVLFEQDKNALAHAWRRVKARADSRFPHRVRLVFLHESIKRLLRDAELFAQFGKFDFVYSCGLYDYLQQRTAVVLTRQLAGSTVPGGQLLVGNMVDHPTRWILEHHLDWFLIYRTRDELLDIGRRAVPDADLRILEEETGVNPILELVHG
jgi:hypothetical protein